MHAPNFRHAHAQAPPASLWGRLTHSKRWAVALVAAIVAPLFLFAAPAQAAVQGTIRGWTSGPQLHFDNHKAETPALINLDVTGEGILKTYCIQINVSTGDGTKYIESEWSSVDDQTDLEKILWILENSYPTLTVAELIGKSDVAGLTEAQAIAGTQAAVWHFSDGMDLNTRTGSGNDAKVIALYQYLTGEENTGIGTQPPVSLSLTPATAEGTVGSRIGPFTVSIGSGTANLSVSGASSVKIYDAASGGNVVTTATNGAKVWIDVPASAEAGSSTLTATAETKVAAGRVFTKLNDPNGAQKLILAQNTTATSTATAKANYTSQPGEVVVTKKVTGDTDINDGTTVKFPITVSSPLIEGGSKTLQLSAGKSDSVTIANIPAAGTTVTVQEAAELPAGWTNTGLTCSVNGVARPDENTGKDGVQVTLKRGEKLACEVTNTYTSVTANLKVTKHDTTENGALLDGAQFQLWADTDRNGTFDESEDTKVGAAKTTDNGGVAEWSELKEGTYFVQETVAPTGFELSDPSYQKVVVTRDDADKTLTKAFANERSTSELGVRKTDADTGKALKGAEFTLFQVAETGDTVVGTVVTGADGTGSIDGLEFGTYYWVETGVPAGYQIPADARSENIVIDASNAGTTITPFQLANAQKRSGLDIVKVDSTDAAGLAGAQFAIWRDGGDGTFSGSATGSDDVLITSVTTTSTGSASVRDLVFGTYFVQETKAPTGYQLGSPAVHKVTVDAANAGATVGVQVANERLLSELTIRKVDASSPSTVLAGATFQLWSVDANGALRATVGAPCTTGSTGTCSVGGLDFGLYRWQETAAPEGYVLPTGVAALSAVVAIDASNAGTAIAAVTFTNQAEEVISGVEDEDGSTVEGSGTTDESVVAGAEDTDESLAATGAGSAVRLGLAALAMIGAGAFLVTARRRGTSA